MGSSHVNEWVLLRIYIYIYTRVTDQMKSTHRRSIVFGEDDEEDDDEEEEDEEEEDEEEEEEEEDEQKKHQQQQQGEKTRDSDGASTERAKTEQQHTTSISIPADHFAVDSTCTSAGTGSTQSDVEAACAASRPNNRTTRMNRSRSISSRDCDVDAIGPAIPIAVSERSALRDAAAFVALEQQLSSVHALSRGATAGYFGTRVMDAFAMCHTHTHTLKFRRCIVVHTRTDEFLCLNVCLCCPPFVCAEDVRGALRELRDRTRDKVTDDFKAATRGIEAATVCVRHHIYMHALPFTLCTILDIDGWTRISRSNAVIRPSRDDPYIYIYILCLRFRDFAVLDAAICGTCSSVSGRHRQWQ